MRLLPAAQARGRKSGIKVWVLAPLPLVTPVLFPAIPVPSIVTPAKAGAQGHMRHIAGFTAFPGTKILSVALGPRFHGGDRNRMGVTAIGWG